MKKWENPELSFWGIERTKSLLCPICNVTKETTDIKNMHYCHKEDTWHRNNCTSLNTGHHQSGSNCPSGGNHEWSGQAHKSNCCCGGGNGGEMEEVLLQAYLNRFIGF